MIREYPRNVLLAWALAKSTACSSTSLLCSAFRTSSIRCICRARRHCGLCAFVMNFFIPLFGRLSEKWGRRRTYAIGAILLAISTYPAFLAMSSGNVVAVLPQSSFVRHHLRHVLRAGGSAVLRSIRRPSPLHRYLVRLSILRNFRERDHADHRHLPDRCKWQSAVVPVCLRRLCRVGQRCVPARARRKPRHRGPPPRGGVAS